MMLINIGNTKNNKPRSFTIKDEFYHVVKKYQDLRPKNTNLKRFFLNHKNGKCTNQVTGKNKFGKMPEQIAKYLGIPNPEEYTGHSFRRTSATLLVDGGADITTLKRHGGWRSNEVAEGYIEESLNNKIQINQKITKFINLKSSSDDTEISRPETYVNKGLSTTVADENQNVQPIDSEKLASAEEYPGFVISNCSHCNIKIYNYART